MAGFFFIDVLLLHDRAVLLRLAIYRGIATTLVLGVHAAARAGKLGTAGPRSHLYGYFVCVVACVLVVLVCRELGGVRSTYYAGVCLVIIGLNTFLPWSLRDSVLASLLAVSIYVVGTTIGMPVDGVALTHNLFFIGGTFIIVVSATAKRNELLRREFDLRHELGASESRFRSVATSAPDGVVVIDAAGDVIFWNHGAERIFGKTADEMVGRSLTAVLPERARAKHDAGLARLRAGGTSAVLGSTVELIGRRPNGEDIPCEVSITAWQTGSERFYSAVIRDISERKRASAELQDDLQQARDFQLALLDDVPAGAGDRVEVVYLPAASVGGDLYDIHALPTGGLRVLVADTTGHGVQAAMRAITVKALYERQRGRFDDPGAVLAGLNEAIIELKGGRDLMLSACCFDVVGTRLRVASAGHPALLRVSGGQATEIEAEGTFVGVVPGATYPSVAIELSPGDRLFAYTDGLIEQFDRAGARVPDELVHRGLAEAGPLRPVLDRLLSRLDDFRGRAELDDDLAVVAIEIPGRPV